MKPSDKTSAAEQGRSGRTSLSQAGGAKKLVVALPGAAVAIALYFLNVAPALTKMVAVLLGAYAAIGLVEVALGESLLTASKRWDELPGWKKFATSLAVIVGALALVIAVMPLVAKLLYQL